MTTPDPASRYKELLGAAHEAARAHAEHVRARTLAIIGEVSDATKEIAAAADAEAKVTEEIKGWWRRHVIAPTASLTWLTPESVPAADSSADPAALDAYLAGIEPATDEFTATLRRATWPRRR
jgi:hypothetical protein